MPYDKAVTDQPKRILVLQTAFLGDLLLAIPLLKNIRNIFPNCEIDLVCRKSLGDAIRWMSLVDTVIEVDKGSRTSRAQAWSAIKSKTYDMLFVPHPSVRSFLWAARIRAKLKVGYHQWWNRWFWSSSAKRDFALPDALRQLSLLAPWSEDIATELGRFHGRSARDGKGELWPVPEIASMRIENTSALRQQWVSGYWPSFSPSTKAFLQTHAVSPGDPVAVIAPGSVWPTKRWLPERFSEVAAWLVARNFRVVFTGTKEERELAKSIAQQIPNSIVSAGDLTIGETLELYSIASVLVSNDSGAMHLASVAGLPTIAVFGPTVLEFGYRPWQDNARVVEEKLDCRPCSIHGGKYCPLGTHDCMKKVSALTVQNELEAMIPRPGLPKIL